ncbi:MAG: hypothetical protein K2X76_15365, partial [Sphingomonas sp.]|nr:hypothetical protein [Sphingomonas sp.]
LAPGNWARAADMQITRAELGATVGAITGNNLISGYGRGVMTDDGIFTPIGYSLGFVGEGAGARANSLAQLDPTAASQLAAVAGGGIQVAALYGTIRKVMAPDASLNFDAAAGIEAGGNSGNVRVVIQVSPAGAESWSDIAVGFEQFVSASEPAFVTAAGGFTNSTGVQQVYEFRAIERRTPGSAGGAVVAAQSFLRG